MDKIMELLGISSLVMDDGGVSKRKFDAFMYLHKLHPDEFKLEFNSQGLGIMENKYSSIMGNTFKSWHTIDTIVLRQEIEYDTEC